MEVRVTQRRCSISQEDVRRAEDQVAKLVRYQPRATAAEVVFSQEKLERTVEVAVHVDGAQAHFACGRANDHRTALDSVLDRLVRMLKKQRGRTRDHRAEGLPGRAVTER